MPKLRLFIIALIGVALCAALATSARTPTKTVVAECPRSKTYGVAVKLEERVAEAPAERMNPERIMTFKAGQVVVRSEIYKIELPPIYIDPRAPFIWSGVRTGACRS